MSENPYQAPQFAAETPPVARGVVFQSRFPLDVIANRTVEIDVGAIELEHRVRRAAETCGYTIVAQRERQWTFRRGSLWHALYTFSVHKLPTTTTIALISPTQIHIQMHCQSSLTFSTPGDEKRFERELDHLETELVRGG